MIKKIVLFFLVSLLLRPFYYVEASATVVISEIAWAGTASSYNDEWIELFNASDAAVDVTDWTLKAVDGQPNITLKGTIASRGYFLLERPDDNTISNITADQTYSGSLGNTGEILELRDNTGVLVEKVDCSSGWFASDNSAKLSMERIDASADANDKSNWLSNDNTTKNGLDASNNPVGGSPRASNSPKSAPPAGPSCGNGLIEIGEACDDSNVIDGDGCSASCAVEPGSTSSTAPTSTPESVATSSQSSSAATTIVNRLGSVLINELVSNPGDGDTEWVELYNPTTEKKDLTGWYLMEGSGAKTSISGELGGYAADKFFAIASPKGSLNNTGDIITLYDPNGHTIDQVSYGNWNDGDIDNNAPLAEEGYSLVRKLDGYNTFNNRIDFAISEQPTRGSGNSISLVSADESEKYDLSDTIVLSELLPYPDLLSGQGEEYIELYNQGALPVNLYGWAITDASDTKYVFKDKEKYIIRPQDYLSLPRSQTKVTLNNDYDFIKLFRPMGEKPWQTVKYDDGQKGQSWAYILSDQKWQWTAPTKGATNVIVRPNRQPVVSFSISLPAVAGEQVIFDASDSYDPDGDELSFFWSFGDGATSSFPVADHVYSEAGKHSLALKVSDGKSETVKEKSITVKENGVANTSVAKKITAKKTASKTSAKKTVVKSVSKKVAGSKITKLSGVVIVPPTVFSTQRFYLQSADTVYEIYQSAKKFPPLSIGNKVEVIGTFSPSVPGRLLVKNLTDIHNMGGSVVVAPEACACEDIGEEKLGRLVSVEGEITEKKGYNIYIDDGDSESIVYIKRNTKIATKDIAEGSRVKVTGLVNSINGEYKILPRQPADIEVLGVSQNETADMPGVIASQTETSIPSDNKSRRAVFYSVSAAVLSMIIAGYWLLRYYK